MKGHHAPPAGMEGRYESVTVSSCRRTRPRVSEPQPSEDEYIAHTRSPHGWLFQNNLAKPINHTNPLWCRVLGCSNSRAKVTREADTDNEAIVMYSNCVVGVFAEIFAKESRKEPRYKKAGIRGAQTNDDS